MSGVMNEDLVKEREDLDWLEARERGDAELPPIDPERAGRYQRMQATLAELPELSAPDGWEGAIYDELDRMEAEERGEAAPKLRSSVKVMLADDSDGLGAEEDEEEANTVAPLAPSTSIRAAQQRRRRWMPVVVGAAAMGVAAAGTLWFTFLRDSRGPATRGKEELDPKTQIARLDAVPTVEISADPSDTRVVRSGSEGSAHKVGSIFETQMTGRGGELRLYRDDREVVARCPGSAGCTVKTVGDQQRLTLRFKLETRGEYRAVYFSRPAGEPRGSLAEDQKHCGCAPIKTLPEKVQ
jgi:hypothetical protein